MRESWRSQRPREMLFDGTIGRAHNKLSSLRVLRYPLGLIFAGGSFVLCLLRLIAGALLARPQAASQGGDAGARQVTPGGSVVFATQIRPILAARCYPCHGPDVQQHGLRLDSLPAILSGSANGKVVIPGDSQNSHIVRRLLGLEQPQMPYGGPPLPAEQIDLVRKWIDEGAQGPDSSEPVVAAAAPINHVKAAHSASEKPVDNFTLARLEGEGLKPSAEADKATLLRRVSLDLTGLPATPAEVDSLVADKSPDAYEKRVDHLLESPHYGERMAMPWLDLARYSDTHGYHIDSLREMWPWRDWVIAAFNRNMPFDEFAIEQLAGDLLPNATLEQKIASGFNRNNMINFEGGAIPEEYHVEYVVDRASTTATTWLGLTMGCARCHDHKYDPIKQKEFYRFFAFFNTVPERGLDGFEGNAAPVLSLPTPEQQQQMDELKRKIAAALTAMPENEVLALRNEWQKTRLATLPEPTRDALATHYPFDDDLSDAFSRQDGKLVRGEITYEDGPAGKAAEFRGESEASLGQAGDFDLHQPFAIAAWVNLYEEKGKVLQKRDASEHWTGYELGLEDVAFTRRQERNLRVVVRLAAPWPVSAIEVRTKNRVRMDSDHHLLVNYDGSGKAAGLKIFVDGTPWETETTKDDLRGSFRTSAPLEIGNKNIGGAFKGRLGDLRIYTRTLSDTEVEDLAVHLPARVLLTKLGGTPALEIAALQPEKPPQEADIGELEKAEGKEQKQARLEKQDQARLSEYFLKHDAPEKYRQSYSQLVELRKEKGKLEKSITTTMVMAEMSKPRDTFVLGRGQYDNKGEMVTPGVPAFLPPMPEDLPRNRLGLAKWIVDDPLGE